MAKHPKFPALLFAAVLLVIACADKDVIRGDELAGAHRWSEAMSAYRAALSRYPRNYDAAWGITKIYCFAVHVPIKCIAWSERLLDIYPENREYRNAARAGYQDKAREARKHGDLAAAKKADAEAKRYSGP